jgi:hypothetical protein
MGDIGRRIGAYGSVGGVGGEIPDPKYPGAPREGILIHSASSSDLDRLYSEGCFAVSKAEWPRFRQALIDETRRSGPMALSIGRDGRAQIMPRSALTKKGVVPSAAPQVPAEATAPQAPSAAEGELNVTGFTKRGEPIYSRGGAEQAESARKGLAATQTNEHKVNGTGKITVDVNAPKGTKVGAEGGGLFKDTEINRQTQMEPAKKSTGTSQSGDEILSI